MTITKDDVATHLAALKEDDHAKHVLLNLNERIETLETKQPAPADLQKAASDQLNRVVASKASVNAVTWQVFSVFTAAMCVLANAFVQASSCLRSVRIAEAGIAASVVWFFLQNRMLVHLGLHESVATVLENKAVLGIAANESVDLRRNTAQATKVMLTGLLLKARWVMRLAIIAIGIVWSFTTWYALSH